VIFNIRLLLLLAFTSFVANANFSVSTQRLYFDNKSQSSFVIIHNKSVLPLAFSTRITHYDMDSEGQMLPVKFEQVANRSAKDIIKYSPKRGVIPPLGQQLVRFKVKKKAGLTAGEYRSYFKIIGQPQNPSDESDEGLGLNARLAHNLPIIVRHGNTNAHSTITSPSLITGQQGQPVLVFLQTLTGNRSVFGHYQVLDDDNNIIGELNNAAIYLPLSQRHVRIQLNGFNKENGPLKVVYKEDSLYGGSIAIEKIIKI